MIKGAEKVDFRLFWGKAGGERPGEPGWHPVAYHCLDVAGAADAVLAASPRKLAVMAQLLGTAAENARRFLVSLGHSWFGVAPSDVAATSSEAAQI
jgi:Cas3, HD domain